MSVEHLLKKSECLRDFIRRDIEWWQKAEDVWSRWWHEESELDQFLAKVDRRNGTIGDR